MSGLRARLTGLVAEHALPEGSARRLRALLDVLETDPTAPTTVTEPTAAIDTHVADALTGLGLSELRDAGRIADLGAGAGFPGLVLAIALPEAQVALVESSGKKVAFLRRAVAAAEVTNAVAVHSRAEEWTEGFGLQDVVSARALAPLGVLVEYAAPLLVEQGVLVAWKGARDPGEERDALAAAQATGMRLAEVHRVPSRPGADHRRLHVYRKVEPTPPRFPRRPGMARKRPLTAPV